jgi:hypothetical protein
MKFAPVLVICGLACWTFFSCTKGNGGLSPQPNYTSFSFSANDTLVSFPSTQVFIQDVLNLQTTVFIGQYADTVATPGNISIRIIGDTTGRYTGDSLLVTYTNGLGIQYSNTADSSNYVQIDTFPKKINAAVKGKFNLNVVNGSDTIKLVNGVFTTLFQD